MSRPYVRFYGMDRKHAQCTKELVNGYQSSITNVCVASLKFSETNACRTKIMYRVFRDSEKGNFRPSNTIPSPLMLVRAFAAHAS